MAKFKRGDRVVVMFEGVVVNNAQFEIEGDAPVRVSVKPQPGKYAWWAVVPESSVELKNPLPEVSGRPSPQLG